MNNSFQNYIFFAGNSYNIIYFIGLYDPLKISKAIFSWIFSLYI